ncbi:hypothetical protein KIPB_009639 [Kipferlia bialata]|uniref:SHSP domain-containing protein n=1 Tax=Kipferlia bialata TaxID=797122 RepID=A0A9K3D1X9_9EUKA|nr:hypothetical protein KIPB_009639 [Kipferlia bialata]|eukprot:g9639.t1
MMSGLMEAGRALDRGLFGDSEGERERERETSSDEDYSGYSGYTQPQSAYGTQPQYTQSGIPSHPVPGGRYHTGSAPGHTPRHNLRTTADTGPPPIPTAYSAPKATTPQSQVSSTHPGYSNSMGRQGEGKGVRQGERREIGSKASPASDPRGRGTPHNATTTRQTPIDSVSRGTRGSRGVANKGKGVSVGEREREKQKRWWDLGWGSKEDKAKPVVPSHLVFSDGPGYQFTPPPLPPSLPRIASVYPPMQTDTTLSFTPDYPSSNHYKTALSVAETPVDALCVGVSGHVLYIQTLVSDCDDTYQGGRLRVVQYVEIPPDTVPGSATCTLDQGILTVRVRRRERFPRVPKVHKRHHLARRGPPRVLYYHVPIQLQAPHDGDVSMDTHYDSLDSETESEPERVFGKPVHPDAVVVRGGLGVDFT